MNPPTLPHQASAPDAEGTPTPAAEDRRHVVKRRWITAIIILLLVGVPAGYLAISTQQSRESGRDKAAKVGASKVRPGWPSKVQRSIYEVPVPDKAWRVGFLETNNWRTSRLYVQFAVTPSELDGFLSGLGIGREDLTPGVSVSAHDTSIMRLALEAGDLVAGHHPRTGRPAAHPGHHRRPQRSQGLQGLRRLLHHPVTGPGSG